MGAPEQKKIECWLTDQPSPIARVWRGALAVFYNKLPRSFRPVGVLHWGTKTGLASSGPFVAYFLSTAIQLWVAAVLSVVIFGANCAISILDGLSRAKQGGSAAPEAELTIRFGEIIAALPSGQTNEEDKQSSIVSALGVIEIIARTATKSGKGEIAASLATYNGTGLSEMRIRHRNPGNYRPINKKFGSEKTLGHYACQAGPAPRVINDIKAFGSFGKMSPTQSSFNYRSIFIIPISRVDGDTRKIVGFVSIDSPRPYAFYGNRASAIIVRCEPFVNHIQELV